MINLHEIQYCTHLFLKETLSHNNTVVCVVDHNFFGAAWAPITLTTWKCGTLKAVRDWIVESMLWEVYQEIIVSVPNKSAVECLPRSKGQRLMKKALVMKELPSDIWHPLLLSSLNQQRETVEGGNSGLYVSKQNGTASPSVWYIRALC